MNEKNAIWNSKLSAWVLNSEIAENIQGLKYIRNYLDSSLENKILKTIDDHDWMQEILRRQQFYGKR